MTLTDPPAPRSAELVVRPGDHQVLADVSAWTDADYRLTDRTRAKLRAAVPANTLRAYERWWTAAAAWCVAEGRVALPMTAETLTEWVRTLTDTVSARTGRPLSVASLDQAVAAVRAVHAEAGFDGMPGTRHARRLIRDHSATLAAAGRTRRQSAIVTADQALDVARRCDPTTAAGARDRLLVALSFGAWTRRSELAALTLADVRVSTDPERPGLYVRFRKSKTDQAAKGAEVYLPERGDALCPLAALRAWRGHLAERGIVDGRLLRGVDRWGTIRPALAAGTVNDISKRLVESAGYAVDEQGRTFTAHGWRASGRSAARAAGASKEAADRHGRWSPTSNTGEQYERDRGTLADHPMAKVAARQAARPQAPGHRPDPGPETPMRPMDLYFACPGCTLVARPSSAEYPTDGGPEGAWTGGAAAVRCSACGRRHTVTAADIVPAGASITCVRCGHVSPCPAEAATAACDACHLVHDGPATAAPGTRDLLRAAEALHTVELQGALRAAKERRLP